MCCQRDSPCFWHISPRMIFFCLSLSLFGATSGRSGETFLFRQLSLPSSFCWGKTFVEFNTRDYLKLQVNIYSLMKHSKKKSLNSILKSDINSIIPKISSARVQLEWFLFPGIMLYIFLEQTSSCIQTCCNRRNLCNCNDHTAHDW